MFILTSSQYVIEDILRGLLSSFAQPGKQDFEAVVVSYVEREFGRRPEVHAAGSFYKVLWWHFYDQKLLAPAMVEIHALTGQGYKIISAEDIRIDTENIIDAVYEKHEMWLKSNLEKMLRVLPDTSNATSSPKSL